MMPALAGFSDNSFDSREDVLRAVIALLRPLKPYISTCGARIKLPIASGTGFDEVSAQLEGYARPLWVVADLLKISSPENKDVFTTGNAFLDLERLGLDSWIRGLAAGVDPEHENFWGSLGNHDQRMVEMEPIACALLTAPSSFFYAPKDIENLKRWLGSINDHIMPPSNWRWFRVLVNLALVRFCGIPHDEVKPIMDEDLAVLDSMYLRDGWSSDGVWSEDKKQADYYSGSFAIQYSQLAYVRFAADIDPDRVSRYRNQAREFSTTFWRYFDVNGMLLYGMCSYCESNQSQVQQSLLAEVLHIDLHLWHFFLQLSRPVLISQHRLIAWASSKASFSGICDGGQCNTTSSILMGRSTLAICIPTCI